MAFDVLRAELERILIAEKIPFDPPRLATIAVTARGSMRGALQLMETEIAYGDGDVGHVTLKGKGLDRPSHHDPS